MAGKETRARIIAVTAQLMVEKGFANVSTRDVTDAAGLSRSHIYHYFANWADLRQEAFAAFAQTSTIDLQTAVAGLPPKEALALIFRQLLPTKGDKSTVVWRGAWDEALHDPLLAKAYIESDVQLKTLLAQLIEQGVARGEFHCTSPAQVARQMASIVFGYTETVPLIATESHTEQALDDIWTALVALTAPRP